MDRSTKRIVRTLMTGVALSILALGAGRARAVHNPNLSDDEVKCQIGTSLAFGKFLTEKAKCLIKCEQGARKSANPASDCSSPFGGATARTRPPGSR
jgi:hypothetical protein